MQQDGRRAIRWPSVDVPDVQGAGVDLADVAEYGLGIGRWTRQAPSGSAVTAATASRMTFVTASGRETMIT